MRRTKQRAQRDPPKTPPNFGSGNLNFTEPKYAARYIQYKKKPISTVPTIDLEALKPVGLDQLVDDLVTTPEWRYLLFDFEEKTHTDMLHEALVTMEVLTPFTLTTARAVTFKLGSTKFDFSLDDLSRCMGFDDLQELDESERQARHINVPDEMRFWHELVEGEQELEYSRNTNFRFRKREYKVLQYIVSRSICARHGTTNRVSQPDLLCLYGIIKEEPVHLGYLLGMLFQSQAKANVHTLYIGPFLTRLVRGSGKPVRISGPSFDGVQKITARNMFNVFKHGSSKSKGKRQKTDEGEDEQAESDDDQEMGEAGGSGEGASSASMTPFEMQMLARMDALQLEQREQRVHYDNRLDTLYDSVNNLQTSVMEIRSFFPPEAPTGPPPPFFPHQYFHPPGGPDQPYDPRYHGL